MRRKAYAKELAHLEVELAKLQGWIQHEGLRVVVVFEGRDSAGKGGTIKAINRRLNPRIVRVVALGTPTEREKSQLYVQRYSHLVGLDVAAHGHPIADVLGEQVQPPLEVPVVQHLCFLEEEL